MFLLLLSLLSYITSPAAAQYYTPTTTWGSVSTFIEAQRFIIQGGSDGTYAIPQTFEIDLSKSWDTSNVPYRHLADGPLHITTMRYYSTTSRTGLYLQILPQSDTRFHMIPGVQISQAPISGV
ncbi:hypothetical protein BCR41DRAFT_113579 [Lobosporangium transversale]|uniref:Uncharacterized protein n=1 Tax=Lobosporangium transversale TaxID=64571 RepID=A0A1Y2GIM7_9FUNG|nr:hypothetical protein BCR41DRAFT_113579 [Lobosporangium transversale]ORZ10914.1 hypothetical protein BCR41DRAFT_113579 [Lobosporangium transversale]|eukprot:XP_021879431.1 hypothetical protein BCR41DRAFT_113579 [Lobosporangium transversale]